jgi:hypothetical protein
MCISLNGIEKIKIQIQVKKEAKIEYLSQKEKFSPENETESSSVKEELDNLKVEVETQIDLNDLSNEIGEMHANLANDLEMGVTQLYQNLSSFESTISKI